MFLNPDTVLLNNAIFLLFKALDKHSNYGAVGGNLFDEKMNPMHSYMWVTLSVPYILRTVFLPKKFYSSIKYQFNFSNKHKKVGYSTGADLMIRRHLFEKVNGFSNVIFMYYEDAEMARRWQKAGYKNVVILGPSIVHLVGGSDRRKTFNRREMVMNSMFMYFTKDRKPFAARYFKFLFKILYVLFFVLEMPIQYGTAKDKIKHIKNVIRI